MKFEVIQNIEAIKKGTILISEPYLGDPNFERSVILITDVNKEGYVGFVLNRPVLDITIQNVLEEFHFNDNVVFVGGPVEQNMLHFIYRSQTPFSGSLKVADGLYFGGDYEELKSLMNSGNVKEEDIRFFIGYSGWEKGQLENEFKSGSWIMTKTDSPEIMSLEPTTLWRTILKSLGGKYQMYSNYPVDPRLN